MLLFLQFNLTKYYYYFKCNTPIYGKYLQEKAENSICNFELKTTYKKQKEVL